MNKNKMKYLWNTINSIINAGMSAILLLVVTRVCGEVEAGNFTLAFSIAQLMVTIGYFEVRPYQVTDNTNKYSQSEYYTFKIITCFVMTVFSIGYVFFGGYTIEKTVLILLICIYKMLDAFEDFFVALYQKKQQLDVGARKSSLRMIASMIIFSLTLVVSKNINVALILAIIISVLLIVKWFVLGERSNNKIKLVINKNIVDIFTECLPLFIGSYMSLYVGNAPKYAIDKYMETKCQTYYGILYMPSFVINLFCGFVFKPMLDELADNYQNNRKQYYKTISKVLCILGIISLVTILGGYLFGTQILGWMYNVDLSEYKMDLGIILLGGAISALGVIVYYMITIMRYQKWMIVSYIATALMAYVLAPVLVKTYGIRGASIGFLLFNFIRVFIFIVIWAICTFKKKKESRKK